MEGYKVIRCDWWTADEFIEYMGGRFWGAKAAARRYVAENPKEVYTIDDEIEVYHSNRQQGIAATLYELVYDDDYAFNADEEPLDN